MEKAKEIRLPALINNRGAPLIAGAEDRAGGKGK
jgi:hypothetical protein